MKHVKLALTAVFQFPWVLTAEINELVNVYKSYSLSVKCQLIFLVGLQLEQIG